jgi:long-subunit acyl-CoA synthetase (AMP-forming)
VLRIAAGLAALGVRRGDTVGLMLSNRIEFYPCDTAALHLGATPFSIYNTSTAEQIQYVFGNAGNAVVITESQFLGRIEAARRAGGPCATSSASTQTQTAMAMATATATATVVPRPSARARTRASWRSSNLK